MTGGEMLNFGGGFGAAAAGIGVLLKWGATAFTTMRAPGGNGPAEWRGRVEQVMETVAKVQDRSTTELSELRRVLDRISIVLDGTATTLARSVALLDEHNRSTAPAVEAVREMARQVDELYRRQETP